MQKKSNLKILLSLLVVFLAGLGTLIYTVLDFQKNQKDYHPKVSMHQTNFKAIDVTGNKSMYQNAQKLSDFNDIDVFATNSNHIEKSKKIEQVLDNPQAPTIIFFGFTNCPEACPTFLTKMDSVFTQLAAYKIKTLVKPNLLFVTVDPKRDTIVHLQKYLSHFTKTGAVGLHVANSQQLDSFLKKMKIFVEMQNPTGKNPMHYNVDHTTSALVYDAKGNLRLFTRDTLSIEDWVHDLKNL